MGACLDYVVIGAGPAGLQLGYLLDRAGRDYLIVEAGESAGTFFRTFPRHRQLISNNKRHTGTDDPELNLRMDWNSLLSNDGPLFTRYSERYFPPADDMVRYLVDFAESSGLRIRYGTRVAEVTSNTDRFRLVDQRGDVFEARRLVVATGPSKPYLPAIPGIQTADCYATVSVDPAEFVDKRVLIIGKGNSAFETADHLLETAAVIHVAGPDSVRLAWRSHYVGHLRAVNNNFLDTYQLKSQNAVLDGQVLGIERTPDGYRVSVSFTRADEVVKDLRYDRVIACTGFRFDHSIFAGNCRPELVINDRFPAQTPAWESTNVPDLYFAGTLMQVRDFKRATSGFIHGFRYSVRALHRILEQRYHGVGWPAVEMPATPDELAGAVLARVNRTSALWQQFGHLCDLMVVRDHDTATHYEELPVDYVHGSELTEDADYFTITLEYGPDHDKVDPFDITVRRVAQNDADRASDAAYLHPVIRHYRHGQLLAEHHVAENLENDWSSSQQHRDPARRFFERELAGAMTPATAG